MAVLALVFGAALVVLVAVVIRNVASTRRSGWAARADGSGDSSWMFVGSDGGGGDTGGADCSGSDAGAGCDGGGGGGGD